jgi:hypothetical protein
VGELTPGDQIRDRARTVERLEEAAQLISDARRLLGDVQGRLVQDEDLRWLVGMLMVHARSGTMLPPRLVPLAGQCAELYVNGGGVARYTVATPVQAVLPT